MLYIRDSTNNTIDKPLALTIFDERNRTATPFLVSPWPVVWQPVRLEVFQKFFRIFFYPKINILNDCLCLRKYRTDSRIHLFTTLGMTMRPIQIRVCIEPDQVGLIYVLIFIICHAYILIQNICLYFYEFILILLYICLCINRSDVLHDPKLRFIKSLMCGTCSISSCIAYWCINHETWILRESMIFPNIEFFHHY